MFLLLLLENQGYHCPHCWYNSHEHWWIFTWFCFRRNTLSRYLIGFIPFQLFMNDKIGFQFYLWGITCDINQMTCYFHVFSGALAFLIWKCGSSLTMKKTPKAKSRLLKKWNSTSIVALKGLLHYVHLLIVNRKPKTNVTSEISSELERRCTHLQIRQKKQPKKLSHKRKSWSNICTVSVCLSFGR